MKTCFILTYTGRDDVVKAKYWALRDICWKLKYSEVKESFTTGF